MTHNTTQNRTVVATLSGAPGAVVPVPAPGSVGMETEEVIARLARRAEKAEVNK
jgi:hypothetical protein